MTIHSFLLFVILFLSCNDTSNKRIGQQLSQITDQSNKAKAIYFIKSFNETRNYDYDNIISKKFIQHNPTIKDGSDAYLNMLQSAAAKGQQIEIIRSIEDEDYVFLQSKYIYEGEKVVYDVFRFDQGLIVEHWDNSEEVKPLNPSGRSQIDGYLEIEDKDKTVQNKHLVKDFLTTLIINKELEKANAFFEGDRYIQHNVDVADGLSSIKKVLVHFQQQGIEVGFKKIHKVIGEGNFVLTINEGYYEDQPTAYFDLFRVDNGKIAEHWDVIENIPPKKEWKNNNGKF